MIPKILAFLCVFTLILSGCSLVPMDPDNSGATPGQNEADAPVSSDSDASADTRSPLDPLPDEDTMKRAAASVTSSELLVLESFPVQINLAIKGTLPTPCHHLRAKISLPDADNKINVEIYSMVNPEEICIQVLQEFDTSLPLGSFPEGTYQVQINGEEVGEFTQ